MLVCGQLLFVYTLHLHIRKRFFECCLSRFAGGRGLYHIYRFYNLYIRMFIYV